MEKYLAISSWYARMVYPYINTKCDIVHKFRQVIEHIAPEVAISTRKNYVTATNKLEKFLHDTMPCRQVTPANITPGQIKALERWLLDSGMSPNYTALLMRSVRALINRINQRGHELFKDVRTQRCQTVKRAVDEQVIKRLRTMKLDNPKENLARYIFLFCFFCMGMPLIDAVHLKKAQLKNGIITYYRRKTHRMVNIVVENALTKVIKAIGTDTSSAYLLPILKSDNTTECYHEYKRFYQRYMRALRSISKKLGLECPLTSYTPRHTWASIAYKNNGDINSISQSLGHANTNITSIYIKEISHTQLKRVNNIVINAVS